MCVRACVYVPNVWYDVIVNDVINLESLSSRSNMGQHPLSYLQEREGGGGRREGRREGEGGGGGQEGGGGEGRREGEGGRRGRVGGREGGKRERKVCSYREGD